MFIFLCSYFSRLQHLAQFCCYINPNTVSRPHIFTHYRLCFARLLNHLLQFLCLLSSFDSSQPLPLVSVCGCVGTWAGHARPHLPTVLQHTHSVVQPIHTVSDCYTLLNFVYTFCSSAAFLALHTVALYSSLDPVAHSLNICGQIVHRANIMLVLGVKPKSIQHFVALQANH